MSESFRVVDLPERPYVAVSAEVTPASMERIADRFPEVFGWLGERGLEPAGPPFFRYRMIDMELGMRVEAGVPLRHEQRGGDGVRGGVLPSGRYVTSTYVGHPRGLVDATARLLARAHEEGLEWDLHDGPEGQSWGCRLECLETDPRTEPDPGRWRTRLELRLAD